MMSEVPVKVVNAGGRKAVSSPVSAGIPFPRGALKDPEALSLAANGEAVPLQAACLSRWPDGSCRWVLLDFQADAGAGASADYVLTRGGGNPAPENPVSVAAEGERLSLSNGLITLTVARGDSSVLLESADGEASAEITSTVEIGPADGRITSKVAIDRIETYAEGPLRAAAALYGRRIYSDGMEGPFSQRIEMFAGSPWVRVEDTFVYAHIPGTHAEPKNPLGLWQVQAGPSGDESRLAVASLMYDEEAEGLVVSDTTVAFYGKDEPFDLSRWTDEELVGEDTPGMALGVGKSAACAFALLPDGADEAAGAPLRDIHARTTPAVYAESRALGEFWPETPGEFEKTEEGLRQILGFWMWFQDNDPKGVFGRGPWHGLFDWGDWQTRYSNAEGKPVGWQYHEGRYGWDCNEMDTNLMLWNAFFHTGRADYWRVAVAMARHMMDVDMINVDYRRYDLPEWVYDPHCYGAPWKEGQDRLRDKDTTGIGRRHNVQHWGNGVGDTRHTWNGGILMYYYATGNRRAYDAVIQMAEMHMQRLYGYACGEYTLSLWCLYNAWQMTGDEKYHDEFRFRLGVIHKLRAENGAIPAHLDFDKEAYYPEVDGEPSGGAGLSFDYISNALADYHADAGDPVARDVLLGLCSLWAERPIRYGETYQDVNYLRGFAWAWRETGEEKYLERVKYWLASMDAEPLEKWPSSEKEWVESTYELLRRQAWRIRHIGPGVRQAPYAMKAISDSKR